MNQSSRKRTHLQNLRGCGLLRSHRLTEYGHRARILRPDVHPPAHGSIDDGSSSDGALTARMSSLRTKQVHRVDSSTRSLAAASRPASDWRWRAPRDSLACTPTSLRSRGGAGTVDLESDPRPWLRERVHVSECSGTVRSVAQVYPVPAALRRQLTTQSLPLHVVLLSSAWSLSNLAREATASRHIRLYLRLLRAVAPSELKVAAFSRGREFQ